MLKTFSLFVKFSLFIAVMFPAMVEATLYKAVDAQGQVYYSDTPSINSQPIEPIETNNTAQSNPITTEDPKTQAQSEDYKVSIINPENDTTITPGEENIFITVLVTPALKDSDTLQLIVDKLPYGDPQKDVSFKITRLERGEHTLQVQIVRKNDKPIQSNSITIYQKQASAKAST